MNRSASDTASPGGRIERIKSLAAISSSLAEAMPAAAARAALPAAAVEACWAYFQPVIHYLAPRPSFRARLRRRRAVMASSLSKRGAIHTSSRSVDTSRCRARQFKRFRRPSPRRCSASAAAAGRGVSGHGRLIVCCSGLKPRRVGGGFYLEGIEAGAHKEVKLIAQHAPPVARSVPRKTVSLAQQPSLAIGRREFRNTIQ